MLWCFDGEVHNGGFDLLFFNSLGDHCLEMLAGIKKVNAIKSYGLLEKAMRCFPESKPSLGREKTWKQLARYKGDENYEADLESLDTEFYTYEDNLAELLHKFVRENKAASLNL